MKLIKRYVPSVLKKLIYRYWAKKYIVNLSCNYNQNKKSILVLNHFYGQDIEALEKENKTYNLIVVRADILFRGAELFFYKPIRDLLSAYDQANKNKVAEYSKECEIILQKLIKRFDIRLIVTPSDNFYWVREFIKVSKKKSINTVVLDKEGLISPHHFDAESERTRKYAPFMSDHIYVWSERQKEYWKKIGALEEDITVIGQARSDLFFNNTKNSVDSFFNKTKPLITFFTYEDDAYVPLELAAKEGLSWRGMKKQTQELLYELAQIYENYNFVFKAHPQQPDLHELQDLYELPNLKVIGGSEVANELVLRSELIIAFQTTSVLEAMFMDKKVIYTFWDDNIVKIKESILPFHEAKGIVVSSSFAEFKDTLNRFFNNDESEFNYSESELTQRNEMVSRYFHKPNGKTCKRFFNHVTQFVN